MFLSSRLLEVITVSTGRWCLIVDAEIVGSWLLLLLLQLRHRLAPTTSVSDEWIVFRPSFWCRRRRRTATCTGEVDAPGHATVQPEPSVSLYTRDVVVPSSGPSILTSLYSAKGSARSWHVRRVSEGQLPLIRKRTKNYGWITEYYNISKVHGEHIQYRESLKQYRKSVNICKKIIDSSKIVLKEWRTIIIIVIIIISSGIRLQKCRDLEIRVTAHSRSLKVLKVAPFDRMCMVSY